MKCPKCINGELSQETSVRGIFFRKKIITTFCPLCDFITERMVRVTGRDLAENENNKNFKNLIDLKKADGYSEIKSDKRYTYLRKDE